jgi:hypothetical protein
MRFSTTSELSFGGEKVGAVEGAVVEVAAAGGAGLGAAGSCAGAELVSRSRGATTRTADRGVRREAKLKIRLLFVDVSRSVP